MVEERDLPAIPRTATDPTRGGKVCDHSRPTKKQVPRLLAAGRFILKNLAALRLERSGLEISLTPKRRKIPRAKTRSPGGIPDTGLPAGCCS